MSDRESRFMTSAEFAVFKTQVEREIKALTTFKDEQNGRASQASVTVTQIGTVVAIILSLIGIVLRFLGM